MRSIFGVLKDFMRVKRSKAERAALILFLLIFTPGVTGMAQGKETEILLLHTNSITGHLFPCPT